MSMCPQTVTDLDNPSRVVRFTCTPDEYYGELFGYGPYWNGVVTSVEVPAPSSPTGTQVYDFFYGGQAHYDPFPGSGSTYEILQLQEVDAVGVNPAHRFWFGYTHALLNSVSLPNGGTRAYEYHVGNVWRQDYPISYGGMRSGQFGYFPVLGVSWRTMEFAGKAYWWDYSRNNNLNCSAQSWGNCYLLPKTVSVTGPYEYPIN